MTKITLDRGYAAHKPGDEIEVSELEIDALVAIGIVRRPAVEPEEPAVEEEESAPMITLNSAPLPEPELGPTTEDHAEDDAHV